MENFELDSKIREEMPAKNNGTNKEDNISNKQEAISDEVSQVTAKVQADDFFSSLELQSSSKTSSNVMGLNFSNKLMGGIVTRSRSFSSTLHETSKAPKRISSKRKGRPKKDIKKRERFCLKRRTKPKAKSKTSQDDKKLSSDGKDKALILADSKKQNSNKLDENILEKSLGFDKNKDDDDWILFNNLNAKKEIDDRMFENKQILANDMQNTVRRCTPELFSMNSILMSDGMSEGKDEMDNLLEVEDYDDSFLEEIEEFNLTPPRSHTGGKWKPGCLTLRTSPMLWQNQAWDSFLDDRHQEEEKRNCPETPSDSPTDSLNKYSVVSNNRWKSFAPPATYTGGKWKPSDSVHRPKKSDQDLISPVENEHSWKYESEREMGPPPTHTGGKWKPNSSHASELWKAETASKVDLEVPPSSHTPGKWGSQPEKNKVNRSTLDVLANCQSTSGKCLKTSGGMIQYYCSPCNRRLSSKKMYKKHIQSELHFKRVLQENELEFDSRSLKLFHGLFTQAGCRERGLGKRVIKKPEIFKNSEMGKSKRDRKIPTLVKIKGKRVARREIIRCEVCRVKIPSYQLGKHLVSYYHSRRIQLNDPEQQKLILDNIHTIVKQAPYQCGICKFYCNSHTAFKKHWALDVHKEAERSTNQRFWCALCSFECQTSRSMELHLDSNSHREVILAINKSIPIIIRHKFVFNCSVCFKEFRFNRELIRHKQIFHEMTDSVKSNKYVCPICQHSCKGVKSLQRHILISHKGDTKVPYFCSGCKEFFNTAEEAKNHRNSQLHKHKKNLSEGKNRKKRSLSKTCVYCLEKLEDPTKLKNHLLEKHPEFMPKCIVCGMVFALSQEASKHIKNKECNLSKQKSRASSPELYTCEKCPFSTNIQSEFLLHSAVDHKKSKNEKFSCPLCSSLFTQTCLSIHLRSHLKERTYKCVMCPKAFVRKDRYVNHLKLRHGTKENADLLDCSATDTEDGRSKKTKGKEASVKPASEHTLTDGKGEKKMLEGRQVCGHEKCKYIAKDLKDLENHGIFHIGPKNYQCPECPYSTTANAIIKRHYLIHIDERSFPCSLCSFKGRLKSHLKRHMRLHTGAKPFKCPHCPYTCNILENLRKHVLHTKIHPGKKLYECKLCDYSTNVSRDFKLHLFKNHKNDYTPMEANEVAGIYNRDDDLKNSANSGTLKVKPKTKTAQPSRKVYSAAFKKKVNLLTQKCSPIAPKPPCSDETIAPPNPSSKNTGNLVEDKRKILKMELEKLKNRIKPTAKKVQELRSPPAENNFRTKANATEDVPNDPGRAKSLSVVTRLPVDSNSSPGNTSSQSSDLQNGVLLVNVSPALISVTEELPSKTSRSDSALQQMGLSSACILYENVLPVEEMQLYLLEDYQT